VGALTRDFAEIRVALGRLDAAGLDELVAEVVHYASFYWYFVAGPVEGLPWVRRALELGPAEPLRARLENSLAMLLLFDDRMEARSLCQAILDRGVEPNDPIDAAWAWVTIGNAYLGDDEPGHADQAYRNALAIAERHGLTFWVELVSGNLASSALELGELDRAEDLARRASMSRDGVEVAQALLTLALVAFKRGDLPGARGYAEQAIEPALAEASLWLIWILRFLARLDAHEGAFERAAMLQGWVGAEERRRGVPLDAQEAGHEAVIRELLARNLEGETERSARARGAALSRDEAVALARSS
jgi:tetratricopeptide (TPR) repeat protein